MSCQAAPVVPIFSHHIFSQQRVGGVNRYVIELHRELRRKGVPSIIFAPLHIADGLAQVDGVLGIRLPHLPGIRRVAQATGTAMEPLLLRLFRLRGECRVLLHRTYHSSASVPRGIPRVETVYDLIHEQWPQYFSAKNPTSRNKRLACESADIIIAISHHTKNAVVDRFAIPPNRIWVCHLGATRVDPEPATRDRLSTSRPFFLYVGNRGGYKNFDRLVRAFSRSRAALDGTGLIAFGGGKQTPGELRCLDEQGVSHLVSFVGGDDASLAAHYATATGLLYPSLDEGFGLPPLEAMLHGCPVAASDAGAIPEVVADAALLFDPTVVESMTAAIDRIASDSALRTSLVSKGAVRAATFTWDAAARTTLSAYAAALELAGARS